MSLTIPQCFLEGSIGTLKKAAEIHEQRGQIDKAIRLMQHAIDLAALRDPEHAEYMERRKLKRVEAERQNA